MPLTPAEPLTQAEKAAGRKFRDFWQAWLGALPPPAGTCSPYIELYRHTCNDGRTHPVRLKEHRELSEDGVFVFIWRDGECRKCKFTVRSRSRLADAREHPAEVRRPYGRQARSHAGDSG